MTVNITPIPAFKDNYIWLLADRDRKVAVIVDPGEAQPVLDYLSKNQLQLTAILLTHKHADHCHGVKELLEHFNVPVYGPANDDIPDVTVPLQDQDEIKLEALSLSLRVIAIPAHTKGHIAYYGNEMLFCGDTLFSVGCGRVFEGTPAQMYQSLQKLSSLPNQTKVFCGHEYTERNIQFALQVEPNNVDLIQKNIAVEKLRSQSLPTLPSTLGEEKEINPFLRCDIPEVVKAAEQHVGHQLDNSTAVFSALRAWKDVF